MRLAEKSAPNLSKIPTPAIGREPDERRPAPKEAGRLEARLRRPPGCEDRLDCHSVGMCPQARLTPDTESFSVPVDDGAIIGWSVGEGPSLLFLHGGPGLSDYMQSLVAEFPGFRCVGYQETRWLR
jgi:pimeloyl-ACP methyl ester carboxylesterase